MFGMISNEIFWHESSLKMLRAAKIGLKAFPLNPYLNYGGRLKNIFMGVPTYVSISANNSPR